MGIGTEAVSIASASSVLITRPVPPAAPALLRQHGVNVVQQSEERPIGRDEFLRLLGQVDAAIVMLTEKIDAEAIAAVRPGFRCFANFAVGHDNLNLPLLSAAGIAATNTPDVLTDATADLAWALLLAAARRVVEADAVARTGTWGGWGPLQFLGAQVTGSTLGIVGAGRIGQATARRAAGFGMRVLYTPGSRDQSLPAFEAGFPRGQCQCVALDDLLPQCDFVSLHVPLSDRTRHLLNRARLLRMKPGSILVNTARGALVEEDALVDLLRSGHLAAAGLDVFEREPFIPEALRALSNVVILPHIGSATHATRDQMGLYCAQSVLAALRGEVPPRCLNPPA